MNKTSRVCSAVLKKLAEIPCLRDQSIRVVEDEGTIVLSGSVASEELKYAAECAAASVYGVKGVVLELDLVPTEHQHATDELIAANAVTQLSNDDSVPRNAIKVEVENGRVTLRGSVEREFQRTAAEQIIWRLSGVVGVTNHITVSRDAMAGL